MIKQTRSCTLTTALAFVVTAVFATNPFMLGTAVAQQPENNDGQIHFQGDEVELALEKTFSHSLIEVDMGDGENLHFVVDTGSPVNVVDKNIADKLGFEMIGERAVGAPGGASVSADIVKVPLARSGGLSIENAEFITLELTAMTGGLFDGVIGMGTFKDYLLTFDVSNSRILVSRDSLPANAPGVMAFDNAHAQIQIDIDVAGHSIKTNIDTGSPSGFTLPLQWKGSLTYHDAPRVVGNARLVGGQRTITLATLNGSVEFAALSYHDPEVAFHEPSGAVGNIGNGILNELMVSIDQRSQQIAFQNASTPATSAAMAPVTSTPAASKPRRLGVAFRGTPGGGDFTIARVAPGSMGEQAGFQSGDVLVKVNDEMASNYDMTALGELIGGSTPLRFDVLRSGKPYVINVP